VAVGVGNVDAHVYVPGAGVSQPGSFVMVVGTSICDLAVSREQAFVAGMTGVVKDGVLPGYYGYEAGQAAAGDMLAWFVHEAVGETDTAQAAKSGRSVYEVLEEQAARLAPGETGLVALDWWNGNRSVLGDADLGGMIAGFSLATKSYEIYRALLESIAFGTRRIIENFTSEGIDLHELVAVDGLAHKSPLLMQLYADICQLPVTVRQSQEIPARGAALFGAVADGKERGGFASIAEAVAVLAPTVIRRYEPNVRHATQYEEMYAIYRSLYEYLGREQVDLLPRLKHRRQQVRSIQEVTHA